MPMTHSAARSIATRYRAEPKRSDYETAYYQKKYELAEAAAQDRADTEYARDRTDFERFRTDGRPTTPCARQSECASDCRGVW